MILELFLWVMQGPKFLNQLTGILGGLVQYDYAKGCKWDTVAIYSDPYITCQRGTQLPDLNFAAPRGQGKKKSGSRHAVVHGDRKV